MFLVTFVLTLAVTVLFLALIFLAFLVKNEDKTKVEELKAMQGDFKDALNGVLRNPPAIRDDRVINGMEYRESEGYVQQSRLSATAIRSAYFSK